MAMAKEQRKILVLVINTCNGDEWWLMSAAFMLYLGIIIMRFIRRKLYSL